MSSSDGDSSSDEDATEFDKFIKKIERRAKKSVKENKKDLLSEGLPDDADEDDYLDVAQRYMLWKESGREVVELLKNGSAEEREAAFEYVSEEIDDSDLCRQAADELVRAGIFDAYVSLLDWDPERTYKILTGGASDVPSDWDGVEDKPLFLKILEMMMNTLIRGTRGPRLRKPHAAAGWGLYTGELIKSGIIDRLLTLFADTDDSRWTKTSRLGGEVKTKVLLVLGLIAELTERGKGAVTSGGKIFPKLIEILRAMSAKIKDGDGSSSDEEGVGVDIEESTAMSAIFLVMRLAQYPPAQSALNAGGVLDILEKFMRQVDDPDTKQIVLVAAASLGGDEFVKKFKSDESTLKQFVELLEAASDPDFQADALTATDICGAISALSVNEENCKTFFHLGMHKPAMMILKHKNSRVFHDAIKAGVASAIMNISFNDGLRSLLEDEGIVDDLMEVKALKPSERDAVEEAHASDFVKAVDGALFNFGVRGEKKEGAAVEEPAGHIMISYNWSHKHLALFLNEQLKARGYRVWIDVESMTGDAVEAMAEAVEGSNAVLWVATSAYKQSANCKLEANYSNKLRKPIVPIMAEPGYRPDGWLGLLLGDKLYFNFREEEMWDESLEKLDGELQQYRTGASKGAPTGEPAPGGAPPAGNQVAPAPGGGDPAKSKKLTQSERIDLLLEEVRGLREDIKANQCACTLQ